MRKKIYQITSFLLIAIVSVVFLTTAQPIFAQAGNFGQKGVNNQLLDDANPLLIAGSAQAQQLSTPGGILSRVLLFAFPIAGLILFVMIIWGGFETIAQSAGKKSLEAGRQRITAAIVGFVLLFVSFWIIRIIETVFGIKILFV